MLASEILARLDGTSGRVAEELMDFSQKELSCGATVTSWHLQLVKQSRI